MCLYLCDSICPSNAITIIVVSVARYVVQIAYIFTFLLTFFITFWLSEVLPSAFTLSNSHHPFLIVYFFLYFFILFEHKIFHSRFSDTNANIRWPLPVLDIIQFRDFQRYIVSLTNVFFYSFFLLRIFISVTFTYTWRTHIHLLQDENHFLYLRSLPSFHLQNPWEKMYQNSYSIHFVSFLTR